METVGEIIARSGIDLGNVEAIRKYLAEKKVEILDDSALLAARVYAFNFRSVMKIVSRQKGLP